MVTITMFIYISIYFRRIISFFQGYPYFDSKKGGFLIIELLIVFAATTIITTSLMRWALIIQEAATCNHRVAQQINQMHNAVELKKTVPGDGLTLASIQDSFDVVYHGTTLTARRFRPYLVQQETAGKKPRSWLSASLSSGEL